MANAAGRWPALAVLLTEAPIRVKRTAMNPADHASDLAENASKSFSTASEQARDMAQRAAQMAHPPGDRTDGDGASR